MRHATVRDATPRNHATAPVRTAGPADAGECVRLLTRAFVGDPPSRWVWPDAIRFLDVFPRFVRAFGGRAFDVRTAHCTAGCSGVALWLPPGVTPDHEALMALLEESVQDRMKGAAFSMFEQMDRHHPKEAHWHLPLIGVDPLRQGKGVGSALLAHALKRCDEERLPAYLEATSPSNVRLYERHGFEPLATIQVADSPPVVPMLRRPLRTSARA